MLRHYQRICRIQRCSRTMNMIDGAFAHSSTMHILEKACSNHSMVRRGFLSFVHQHHHASELKQYYGINRNGSTSYSRPISMVTNKCFTNQHLRQQQQHCRGLNVSALSLISKRRQRQKITMITAYDFPSAIHVARANIDIVLVGDSVAMVELGHETTQPITMNDMIHHCTAVARGVSFANNPNSPLLVGDMPFGSYEFEDTDVALQNAYRFVKEAGMDAVKLEVRLCFGFCP